MLRKLVMSAVMFATLPQAIQNNHSTHARTQTPPAATLAPIPENFAANSYAIYSLLMPGSPFDTLPPEQTRRWAVADATVSITDMDPAVPPDGQLKPPPNHAQEFQQAIDDFEARKYLRFRLQAGHFNLGHAFDLLSQVQVQELRSARGSIDPGSGQQAQYAAYPGVTFFSAVYFNSGQTAALVYMNDWCANLCAAGQWVYLEKRGGQWVRRSGILAKGA